MNRLLIPFVAAFGLSLGVATGVVMMRAPKTIAAVAKTAQPTKDSIHAGVVKHDTSSQAARPDPAASATAEPANAANVASGPVMLASKQGMGSKGDPGSNEAAPANTTAAAISGTQKAKAPVGQAGVSPDTVVGKKLAKVFGAMQAKDAARVLQQMDDGDVQAILASLSNKQQAAILETFPTQRAATIMRATLRNAGSEQ